MMNSFVPQHVADALRGMWQGRWAGLVVAWLAAIAGGIFVHLVPDRYEATARVYVDTQSLLKPLLQGLTVQPNVDQEVTMQQLRQRVIAAYHLGPLDPDETRAYIEHRLKHVGWQHDPRFEDAAFPAIYAHTAGVPRRINTLCTRLLLAAFLSEKHAIGAEDVERVLAELSEEFGEAITANGNGNGSHGEPPTLAGLEKRVVGVEKAMNITVNLLRQFIRERSATQNAS